MSDYVIVRINDKLVPKFQINYTPLNSIVEKHKLSGWSDIQVSDNQTLILLISANLVYNTTVIIPSKNDEVIRQSLAYAIEEEMANDITENHYAYKSIAENKFLVSVIKLETINKISELLSEYGYKSDKLYSEIFACPSQENICNICQTDDGYSIINHSGRGTLIQSRMVSAYNKISDTDKIVIYSRKSLGITNTSDIKNVVVNIPALFAKTITSDEYVNLFQGRFKENSEDLSKYNPVKKLSVLIAVFVISWLLINILKLNTLSEKIEDVRFQQQELLRQSVININESELNDPYSAMNSRLQISAQGVNKSSRQILISSLSYLGATLLQFPDISIQSLRLRENKVEVKIEASDLGLVNRFQSSLEKTAIDMRVNTGTRDSINNGVSSTITMESL